jgi:hypothetical protein
METAKLPRSLPFGAPILLEHLDIILSMGRLTPSAAQGHLPAPEPPSVVRRNAPDAEGSQATVAPAFGRPGCPQRVHRGRLCGPRPWRGGHRPRDSRASAVRYGEAGPCGSGRSRSLTQQGYGCGVVVPALLPTKAGARVHPDRRAALPLARRMRSGDLSPSPSPPATLQPSAPCGGRGKRPCWLCRRPRGVSTPAGCDCDA